jgi:hypothetical protein
LAGALRDGLTQLLSQQSCSGNTQSEISPVHGTLSPHFQMMRFQA